MKTLTSQSGLLVTLRNMLAILAVGYGALAAEAPSTGVAESASLEGGQDRDGAGRSALMHPFNSPLSVAGGILVAQVSQPTPVSPTEPVPSSGGAPTQRQRIMELPQISVVDKLLSIEMSLATAKGRTTEDAWADDYGKLYARFRRDGTLSEVKTGGEDQVYLAIAVGIKASDAIMALKARDVEALKASADQVEVLARKLGVTDAELGMTRVVRRYAEDRQWFDAFSALGRLQRNVLAYLRDPVNEGKRPLASMVIIGGWLQGGRCVTAVVDENYTELVSNVLREGRLVALLQENLETQLTPEVINHEFVRRLLTLFPEIHKRVNIGFEGAVPQTDVVWLHQTFDQLVKEVLPNPKN